MVFGTLGFAGIVVLLCTVFTEETASMLQKLHQITITNSTTHEEAQVEGALKLLGLISIPVCSVLFTYAHIWLALWMMFYPIDYLGKFKIPGVNFGLGWQGILPFKINTGDQHHLPSHVAHACRAPRPPYP